MERADQGRGWLAGALGPLVKAPLTALQTPEQAIAEYAAADDDHTRQEPSLPLEETAALLHKVEDHHYRGHRSLIAGRDSSPLDELFYACV